MRFNLPKIWKDFLENEDEKEYMLSLRCRLNEDLTKGKNIHPKATNIFKAFELTSPNNAKVIILGQDPYHGFNQANGLCFSVPKGFNIPPSLRNIYKEIKNDLGINNKKNGDLTFWAKQGVLLLNTTLTVEEKKPGSHSNLGWEFFTDKVISYLGKKKGRVFILWGNRAAKKANLIDSSKNLILISAHPSPLSAYRGFFGCNHFSQCNNYLKQNSKKEIDWVIK
ncbi:uracil-DNA glycosylase [SAR86 cluster bacterium]|nr:uracil-DNA glycosylase [SAR86 cluster bacterium]